MNRRLTGLLLSTLLATCALASVEIRSRQITIGDGLANNSVRHFMQDSKGFIWMGTLNGLNRYDGNSFISYYPSLDTPLSLSDRKVFNLSEDKNGFLWICFSSGLYSCYDLKSASFVDYTGNGDYSQKYQTLMFANNGDIWLRHDSNGARRVIYENGTFRSVTYKLQLGNLPDNNVTFISEGEDGAIWVGTSKGLVRVVGDNHLLVDAENGFHHAVAHRGNTYFCSLNGEFTCSINLPQGWCRKQKRKLTA